MASNFEFLTKQSQFNKFSYACLEAEKSIAVSPATAAILSRRALELAVKWLYESDSDLTIPYQDNLSSLIHERTFREIIEPDLFPLIRYIIKLGNLSAHSNSPVKRDEVVVSLHNLHQFISWLHYCYSQEDEAPSFREDLLPTGQEENRTQSELQNLMEQLGAKDKKLQDIVEQNEDLRKQLTIVRRQNTQQEDFQVDTITEYQTRKKYIDVDLKDVGWVFGEDCIEEFELQGMPFGSGTGYADYVLFADNGKPLAVVEAKRTSVDPDQGKHQATLYANCLEQQFGQRPIIFYTNGFKTYLWDDHFYPERLIHGFYSKEDLQLRMDRRSQRIPLANARIKDAITDRYYQKEAIKAVCEAFAEGNREALLVMATGSGKTRTVISLVDILSRHQWVKNVLFLADRTALVKQAKKNFNALVPDLSLCNLLDNKDSPESRVVFSTYPTMMNAIDEAKLEGNCKLFTVGHFDMVIIDEAHRSIFNKYQAIFDYFDALLVGLTATPKEDIDRNTYSVFKMENKVPTYAYELRQAVEDGYLVPYNTIETQVKFLEEGIHYDELSEEEKEEYENTFLENGYLPEYIPGERLNAWIFNADTIDRVLAQVLEMGLKIEGGDKLGKTIIFARNHNHAVRIVERFNAMYPRYKGDFCKVIDNKTNYAQHLIETFSAANKMPQIAVSVDMLDTGIDIPEVMNLIFFKKVRSKTKFWQMLGRGTRLCPDIFGPGKDKERFLIFDYCGNFEFFRVHPQGIDPILTLGLTQRLFITRLDIVQELQHVKYQDEHYETYRSALMDRLQKDVKMLNRDSFVVKQKLEYVDKYRQSSSWQNITAVGANELKKEIAPLLMPDDEDELAKRFDHVILSMELALLLGKEITRGQNEVQALADQLSELGTIPQVRAQKDMIEAVQNPTFWEGINIHQLEEVREALRDLIKFLEQKASSLHDTNFTDEILQSEVKPGEYEQNDLKDYRKKVNQYLRENQYHIAIHKLRTNKRLTEEDFFALEQILWKEVGTKEDYEKEFGNTPLTLLVRQIVGLDLVAANEAFSEFLDDQNLSSRQIRFVKAIIDYVVHNGFIEKQALQQEPFQSIGSIVDLFPTERTMRILSIIDNLKDNATNVGAWKSAFLEGIRGQ